MMVPGPSETRPNHDEGSSRDIWVGAFSIEDGTRVTLRKSPAALKASRSAVTRARAVVSVPQAVSRYFARSAGSLIFRSLSNMSEIFGRSSVTGVDPPNAVRSSSAALRAHETTTHEHMPSSDLPWRWKYPGSPPPPAESYPRRIAAPRGPP